MDTNIDARRGLGVRPGRVPELRLNLGDDLYPPAEAGPSHSPRGLSPSDKKSPTFRDFSLPVPRKDTSPTTPRSPSVSVGEFQARLRRATLRPKEAQPEPPRGLHESQKLLSYVLDRLESRDVPPDTLARAASRAKAVGKPSKEKSSGGAVRHLGQAMVESGLQATGVGVSSAMASEERVDVSAEWDAKGAHELVTQLRDLLLLADKQGLRLLGDPGGQHRKSADTHTARDRVMRILCQLMSADCHYRVASFSPLSPPQALQAVTLDIATYLCHTSSGPDRIAVVEVVVDGLYTFEAGMLERVLSWLEGRMGETLERLADIEPKPGVPSFSFTPDQPQIIGIPSYHTVPQLDLKRRLSSLVVQLLTALCGTDLEALSGIHRVHRLFALLLSAKPDASLDLLEIVASGSSSAQRVAMSILTTYYPLTMGHTTIARAPPDLSYQAQLAKWETGRAADTDSHHYVHWRVSSKDPSARACTTCEGEIHGFCIKCTLCGDVLHLDCYRPPEGTFRYELDTGVVFVKFSRRPLALDEKLEVGTRVERPARDLHRVHLFTATPCQACRRPIWAAPSSVFACLGCQSFLHAECADAPHTCQPRRIWPASPFQAALSLEGAEKFCVDPKKYSHDEIAILYGALWLRYQTLKAGLAAGSLTTASGGTDPLNLRPILRSYEDFLRDQAPSGAAADFAHIYGYDLGPGYLFSEPYLTYVTALLKSPDGHGTYSALSMESVRASLRSDLCVELEPAVDALSAQLELSGLIRITPKWVHFDLPILAESSPAVEILIQAIAACLDSLDLTMVEQGLLLLTSRAWPSLLCTPHALEHLALAVFKWVMSEDESLHRIVREYASKHRPLPGLRPAQGSGTGSVQLYQEARNALLRRYVQPWLEALHTQDPELYLQVLYDQCRSPTTSDAAGLANLALDRLVAVVDAGVAFSGLLELLTLWLEDLGELADQDTVFKPLPRLLSRHISPPPGTADPTDIFSFATGTASTSPAGLAQACRWIRVLAFSGVEVPWSTIRTLIDLGQNGLAMAAKMDIAIAGQTNVGYIGPVEMADLCGGLLVQHIGTMKKYPVLPAGSTEELYLTRLLNLVLRAYGVPDERAVSTTLHNAKIAQKQTVSGAKPHARRSAMMALRGIPLDEAVVLAAARLIQLRTCPITPILDFLWLVFTQASAVSNADETVYTLAPVLYKILWPLVDLDLDRRSRARLLLKLITVSSPPLESLVSEGLAGPDRHRTAERLLKLMLDLGDSTVTADSKNWQSHVTETTILLFSAISDPEHADPAAMTIRKSLLPAQLLSFSTYFEATLAACSDERRLGLLVRLRRLRLAFPDWPVISWPVLDELLTETVVSIKQAAPGKSSQNVFALLDSQNVRYHLIALGLDMLASGIPIPYVLAQRFQQHVAALCALPWQEPSEGVMDIVLPALRDVLDSPKQILLSSTHDTESATKKKMALVGSLFVPAVIDFAGVLADKPILAQRCILDALLIIFHKHNVVAVLHPALRALQNVSTFIEESDCADNRILALAVAQAALDRMQREDLVRVIPAVFLSLASALCEEVKLGGNVTIIDQCGILLRRMIKMFGRAGLLLNVVRLDGADITAPTPGKSIPAESLLLLFPGKAASDSISVSSVVNLLFNELPDILKRGRLALEQALAGLARFVPVIRAMMTSEAVEAFGSFLGKLGKHIAEWTSADFNPEHIWKTAASLLEVMHGPQTSAFPSQVATFLHLCLARFDVNEDVLRAIISTSATFSAGMKTDDVPRAVVDELAVSAALGLGVTSTTLSALLEHIIFSECSSLTTPSSQILQPASQGCLKILQRLHPALSQSKQNAQQTLEILERAGAVLLLADDLSPGRLGQSLAPLVADSPRQQLDVFTSLLLSSVDRGRASPAFLNLYPILARAVTATLRQVGDLLVRHEAEAAAKGAELLSSVLIAVRLAFLASAEEGGNEVLEAFRLGVDAEWIRLISLSLDPLCLNTPLRATTHSVYLDTILFLASMSSISFILRQNFETGLEMLVRYAEETGSGGGKLTRAVEAMANEGLGVGPDRQKMLDSVKADMAATERLRSLRTNSTGI